MARAGDTADGSIAVNPTRRGHMASMATRLVTTMVLVAALGLGACASSDTMTSGDKMGGDKAMGDKAMGDKAMGDKTMGDKTMMKDDMKKGDSMMEKK
jgi:hypothetical protein